ncbi:MAG TPA: diaminobutyrate--2-oxoglutarate transaminase [Candidatus Competibacteraceae bacterium]|nr:diaminobutyrate--2-oxoglutarate transaminase [Candidatus Competibacteraceae bacterium]HAO33712.1 diaminobutyrate--2-oxoglutarate transaminase [Candidatus Competibacteraceae bacterium]
MTDFAVATGIDDACFVANESAVRAYCRSFPAVLIHGRGAWVYDEAGGAYLDFLAGAGTLNYGHNDPRIKRAVLDYLADDGIVHSLDFYTRAKRAFLEKFRAVILEPRGLEYRIQFPSPSGATAVEAALKLARKVTGRSEVIAFTNAFHGMTLGALAATGSAAKRAGAGIALAHVTRMPYDGYLGPGVDTLDYLARALDDPSSGIAPPAAFLVETVQGEGGLNVASGEWLRRLQAIARVYGSLLIIDDIQAGCGRSGAFFSFERAGLDPDLVCLAKAIGGMGLPLALLLIKPQYDQWRPGEHNGTFRGNNLAFVAGAAALDYWADARFVASLREHGALLQARLQTLASRYAPRCGGVRGLGLMQGLWFTEPSLAGRVSRAAFRRGLIAETCGPRDEVLKLLPPLTIDTPTLRQGLDILETALVEATGVTPITV